MTIRRSWSGYDAGWHRRGFRLFWTWKSRRRLGRPVIIPPDIRLLIRRLAEANPLWGAPRIHGELLKLGIDVSQATVARYMARRQRPPSDLPIGQRSPQPSRPEDTDPDPHAPNATKEQPGVLPSQPRRTRATVRWINLERESSFEQEHVASSVLRSPRTQDSIDVMSSTRDRIGDVMPLSSTAES